MRYAVIDLGTNTFNLLIAEDGPNKTYKILLNTKEAVKLGEGGINHKIITEAAFDRGLNAIGRHFDKIAKFNVQIVRAFATSAIRDAANGLEFATALKSKYDLNVIVIPGDKEAELIYKGVKQILPFANRKYLILDIGGGSNEFIIANDNEIFWKHSFNLGMARLLDRFKPNSPISQNEIDHIEVYLHNELSELHKNVDSYKPEIFIGASGSFDSLVSIMDAEGLLTSSRTDPFHEIPLPSFSHIYNKLIKTSKSDRENMLYLEPVRKDMIVLATIFVNYVLKLYKFQSLYQSAFSLKEGALTEMIENESKK